MQTITEKIEALKKVAYSKKPTKELLEEMLRLANQLKQNNQQHASAKR